MTQSLIIAEAGVNHNGDIALAFDLIDAAADAGADLIKFQSFFPTELATPYAQQARYQVRQNKNKTSQLQMLSKLALTQDQHFELIEKCNSRNITFFSTAFDLASLDFLSSLDFERFKIPSGEVNNLPYLEKVASYGKGVILSTGMCDLNEVTNAIQLLIANGIKEEQITVLHCTSEYPAPIAEVNLRAMITMRDHLNLKVGYSDHTLGIEVSVAAVAMGASVIEKHFTLDKTMDGPDHKASLNPTELTSMINAIRNVEVAMGDGEKKPSISEIKNRSKIRKSLVAATSIQKGEVFTTENLTTKRPGHGISPMQYRELLGTNANKSYDKDELITL